MIRWKALIFLIFLGLQSSWGQLNVILGIGFQASSIDKTSFGVINGNGISSEKFGIECNINPSLSVGLTSRFSAEYYLIQGIDPASNLLKTFDIEYVNFGTGIILNYWMNDDWELNLGYGIDRLRSLDIDELSNLDSGINILNSRKDVAVAETGISYYVTRRTKLYAIFRFRPVVQKGQAEHVIDNLIREYYAIDVGGQYKIPMNMKWKKKPKKRRSKKSNIGCPE